MSQHQPPQRSLYRVKSAGAMSRPHSGSSAPQGESRALRETVTSLQQDLLLKNMECQQVTDQLNCLISLVKRSWAGDNSAAIHVAKIVGAAPPDFEAEERNGQLPGAKVKSSAVNNWAVLTVGLLNRYYRSQERLQEEESKEYLDMRVNWLEGQLLFNRDLSVKHRLMSTAQNPTKRRSSITDQNHNRSSPVLNFSASPYNSPMAPPPPSPQPQLQSSLLQRRHSAGTGGRGAQTQNSFRTPQNSRPPSGKKPTTPLPVYRHKKVPESDLKWSDFVTDPTKQQQEFNKPNMRRPHHDNKNQSNMSNSDLDDRSDIPYDDPHRYAMFGLFDNDHLHHLNSKPPPSAVKQQRESDNKRSRPKSASVSNTSTSSSNNRTERPLKFETTRPVSAPKSRASSAPVTRSTPPKVKVQGKKPLNEHGNPPATATTPQNSTASDLTSTCSNSGSTLKTTAPLPTLEDFDYDEFLKPETKTRAEQELEDLLNVDTTKLQSVSAYEEDMEFLTEMERNFRTSTLELQKKLGLPLDGLV